MADVYSYSMVIFHVITRTPPWVGVTDSIWARLEKEALDEVGDKKTIFKPEMPSYFENDLKRLVEDCWNNNSAFRPTFEIVISRLEKLEKEAAPNGLPP